MHTRIFLIGFMGSGKSYWARHLSLALDLPLIELDERIARTEGMSIAEIFAARGEARFRELEHLRLQEALAEQAFVLSTGGGLPCFYGHMELMNREGLTLWLNSSVEAMAARLRRGKEKRPLLRSLREEELEDYIREKLRERRPFYGQARLILNPETETTESIIHKIEACKKPI